MLIIERLDLDDLAPCPRTAMLRNQRHSHRRCASDIHAKLTTPPRGTSERNALVHLADEGVDVLLTVAEVTALNEVLKLAWAEAASWVGQLEWPEEVASLLEVGANGVDLVDQIFHADNAVLAEVLLDDGIVGKWQTLLVDLAISTLVDELADRLEVRVAVSDEWLNDTQHLDSGLGQADEDTIVDLQKTEQLQSLALLGVDLVDTLDTDNEGKLGLSWDVEGALSLGQAVKTDLLTLCIAIFLDVLLCALEDDLALLLVGSALLLEVRSAALALLLLRLALLEERLWWQNVTLGWDRTGAVLE